MPQLLSQFERARHVISQPPEARMDHEIKQLVPWLRSKAKLFKQLKAELLADILRYCNIETKQHDDVIIKQGDTGECFYIVLSGKVSIYILNKDEYEGMEDDNIFDNLLQYNDKGKLNRDRLGYMVTHLGTGAPFGEVALMSDSVRTASIIAEEATDLLVVDRKLYNRSIKEVLAKEFQEKTNFIASNPLFRTWAPKYRKQLAMALYKETFGYESSIVRQGDRTDEMFFILSGQVEIQVDPAMHPHQYPRIFKAARENEVEKLVKKVAAQKQAKVSKEKRKNTTVGTAESHLANPTIKRRDSTKCTRLCHLGVNETVGDLELTLDLPTYMQTAVCTETTSVLVLEHRHYVRLFTRRHPRTIDAMREEIGVKVESRLSLLNLKSEIPFLQYVCQIIASQHHPAPSTDIEPDQHTVMSAEKEFLRHKGPLIDQHGPGSVFFLINLREKTKMRLRAKRGGQGDRQMLKQMQQNGVKPRSYRDMQLLTQLVDATREDLAAQEAGENGRHTGSGSESDEDDRPITAVYNSQVTAQIENEAGEGNDLNHRHDKQSRRQDHNQQEQQLQQQYHSMGRMAMRSPEQLSPRPGTGWLSLGDPMQDNSELDDARLSTLEARLRHFLQAGNPKERPQVTQLRRLALEDMEVQPKPGNKVVVRRRDPYKSGTPSTSPTVGRGGRVLVHSEIGYYNGGQSARQLRRY